MLFETVAAAFLAALIAGGRIRNLEQVEFRHIWLVVAAFLVQLGLDAAAVRGYEWVSRGRTYVHIFSYLLLFAAIYLNWSVPGMKLLGFGSLLNFLVVAGNHGIMPVRGDILPADLFGSLAAGKSGTHDLLLPGTRLKFLSDIIYVPLPYQKQLLSIGDIVLDAGAFFMIFCGMRFPRSAKSYKFTYVNRKL